MTNTQNNEKRFVYFYFNRNEPEKIRQVVPAHVQYWKTANLKGYMGGPFGDRTGKVLSLTGFLAFCLASAVEEDKSVQAYLMGCKQLVIYEDVGLPV